MLSIRNLTKRFDATLALNAVSLDVSAGEVLGLIGQNGAGKSTLIKCLAGAVPADAGTIALDGKVRNFRSPADAKAAGIRVVHQDAQLIGSFSAVDNAWLGRDPPRRFGLIDRKAMRQRVVEVAVRVAPELPLDMPAMAQSAASRQLIQIVRALMEDPRVLILDEPTAALSATEAQRLISSILALKAQGVAVIFTGHRLEEVLAVSDRVAVLRDGQLIEVRSTGKATSAELATAMTGSPKQDVARKKPLRGTHGLSPALVLSGISARPGQPTIDLTIGAGEVVALYGLVGAGRSRLLKMIWGARQPARGTMTLNGAAYSPRSPCDAIKTGIGYVPDDRRRQALVAERSLVDNLTLPSLADYTRFFAVLEDKRRAAFVRAAQTFGIVHSSPHQRVATLSGGNQQKLIFGRWLKLAPRLLLLDEPTEGVDIGAKQVIHGYIRALAATGTAVLVATSDKDEALALADRIVIMARGAMVGDHRADELDPAALVATAG